MIKVQKTVDAGLPVTSKEVALADAQAQKLIDPEPFGHVSCRLCLMGVLLRHS